MKKKFLSRIARRKDSAPAKPDEGHEIPPPTAIEPGVPYSENEAEQSGYGSHFELLASGETPIPDATGETDAQESADAPALESLAAPVSGEPPDATETSGQNDEAFSVVAESVTEATAAEPEIPKEGEPEAVAEIAQEVEEPRAAAVPDELSSELEPPQAPEPLEGYGDDFEALAVPESGDSSEEVEPPREDEETAARLPEKPVEPPDLEPEVLVESESETIGDAAPEFEEAPDAVQSVVGGYAPLAPEIPEDSGVRIIDDAVSEDEEPLAASISGDSVDEAVPSHEPEPLEGYGDDFEALAVPESDDSPDEAEPPLKDEEPASGAVDSVAGATVSDPATPQESEPEAVQAAADLPSEEPEEASEPHLTKNGLLPLVRDARGAWRPGKGFSRSELHEAGLSPAEAARLRIRVDKRRRNAHPVNVATLERAKSGV